MPNRLLFDATLPTQEKAVYLVIQHYARVSGIARPSRDTIAKHLDLSPNRVGEALQMLEAGGYVRAASRRHGFVTEWAIVERLADTA